MTKVFRSQNALTNQAFIENPNNTLGSDSVIEPIKINNDMIPPICKSTFLLISLFSSKVRSVMPCLILKSIYLNQPVAYTKG